jgi:nitronate monooxygenase
MADIASPALATAVSCAGGIGFIGPGLRTQDCVHNLEEAASLMQNKRAKYSVGRSAWPKVLFFL